MRAVARLRLAQRIGAVGIVARLRALHEEKQQDQPAEQRDQRQQHPPARFAIVVQAAHRDGERGHQQGEACDDREWPALAGIGPESGAVRDVSGAEKHRVEDAGDELHDDVE